MTRLVKSLSVALLLSQALTLPAQEPKNETEKKRSAGRTEIQIGTGIEAKALSGAAEAFRIAPDTKLYVWTKVAGVPADSKVTVGFWKGDKEAYKREFTVASDPYRTNVYRTFRAGDGGDWTAKVLGPDGAELAVGKFTVEIQK